MKKNLTCNRNRNNLPKSATLQEKHIPHLSFQVGTVAKLKTCRLVSEKSNIFASQEPLNVKTSHHLSQLESTSILKKSQSAITPTSLQTNAWRITKY